MKYVLMSDEISAVERLSENIERLKRFCNVQSKKVDVENSDFIIGKLGLMAEWAVSKLCGFPINMELFEDSGDFGIDGEVRGKTIDVKFSRWPNGKLIFKHPGKFVADIAVFCVPGMDQHEVEMVGVISRKRFMEQCERRDLGYGDVYCVTQDKLTPFETFLEWARK